MKEKLTSRKFWIALLSNIISITVIFRQIGGNIGVIAGIIGTIAASISYMITECRVDTARAYSTYKEVSEMLKEWKEGKNGEGNILYGGSQNNTES